MVVVVGLGGMLQLGLKLNNMGHFSHPLILYTTELRFSAFIKDPVLIIANFQYQMWSRPFPWSDSVLIVRLREI